MGHVVHAIHRSSIDLQFEIESPFKELINRGVVKNPQWTNFDKFIESGTYYIPDLSRSVHVGSMFTVRTVLPHYEDTDGRPTIVDRIDERTLTVFSGKMGTCIGAAQDVVDIVG
jgi:hypothetical protein